MVMMMAVERKMMWRKGEEGLRVRLDFKLRRDFGLGGARHNKEEKEEVVMAVRLRKRW